MSHAHCLKTNVVFEFLAFSTNFCPFKIDLSGNTVFKKLTIFAIFHELLSTQNVNVARFARKVECDFICDFQTPCYLKNCNFRKNELASRTTVFCGDCIRDDS